MAKLASAQAQNFSIPHFVCCVNVFSLFAINLRTAIEQRILVMPTYPILTNFTPYLSTISKVFSLLLLVDDVGLKIFYRMFTFDEEYFQFKVQYSTLFNDNIP